MYRKEIEAYFADKQDQILADIARLVNIKSEREPMQKGMPFGKGPYLALMESKKLAEERGLSTKNFDNYVITAEIGPQPAYLGILAHVDVVSEGSGWTVPPYEMTIRDGRIYGRGTADDKGPAVVALWALKAAQELCPQLSRGVRLILGSAEETGSEDLEHYLPLEAAPPLSFSPDAEYPLINLEKGGYKPVFGAKWDEETALPRVCAIHGGTTTNIVTRECDAWLEGISADAVRPLMEQQQAETGVLFTLTEEGKKLHLHALGVSAHAASPETGKNAQIAMVGLLAKLPLAESCGQETICNLAQLFPFGDDYGQALGVAQEDEVSGKLTLVFSKLEFFTTGFLAQFDSRCPLCANEGNVRAVVEAAFDACHFEILERPRMFPPHHTPADSLLCRTLLETYEDHTGQKGECLAIGGGTYVHDIEGGVAFGCAMPGTDNRMHGADEFAVIDELMTSAKIFTDAILRLCK